MNDETSLRIEEAQTIEDFLNKFFDSFTRDGVTKVDGYENRGWGFKLVYQTTDHFEIGSQPHEALHRLIGKCVFMWSQWWDGAIERGETIWVRLAKEVNVIYRDNFEQPNFSFMLMVRSMTPERFEKWKEEPDERLQFTSGDGWQAVKKEDTK